MKKRNKFMEFIEEHQDKVVDILMISSMFGLGMCCGILHERSRVSKIILDNAITSFNEVITVLKNAQ